MAQYVNSTFGPPNVVPVNIIIRKSANYHPSIWGDKFLVLDNSAIVKTDANCKEEGLQLLKNNVKKMLCAVRGTPQQDDQLMISLIDDIQRLGLSYHFETEIDTILQHIQDSFCEHDYGSKHGNGDYNLHDVALCFRLLRQQGHNVSSDVFYNFKDSNGKFKENLVKDVRGMLSLFEATHLRVHGEDILEDALEFTTSHLNQYLKSINQMNPLASLVDRALKYPLRRGLNRLVARHYISIYHQFHWHNQVLLELAKCDFNLVQKLHQMELCHVTRWWKNLDVANNFPFARDRLVECYFWITGVYFEPRYAKDRIFLTKIISMTSIVDDIYDVHGTVEEVQQFTDAIEKWDISAIDQLPEYMTLLYQTFMDVFSEAEEDMAKAGIPSHGIGYAKDAYKRLTREYLQEAKWSQSSYFPTYEEYVSVALVTGAYPMLSITSLVYMSNVASREAFDWISKHPLIVRAASVICRLSDDIAGHEFEMQRPYIPTAVECFMKEHGVPKETAYVELKKVIVNAWKDMNQECLNPIPAPMQLLARVFNFACVVNLLYDGDDGYTNSSTTTKDMIIEILIDPIPE